MRTLLALVELLCHPTMVCGVILQLENDRQCRAVRVGVYRVNRTNYGLLFFFSFIIRLYLRHLLSLLFLIFPPHIFTSSISIFLCSSCYVLPLYLLVLRTYLSVRHQQSIPFYSRLSSLTWTYDSFLIPSNMLLLWLSFVHFLIFSYNGVLF